MFRKIFLVSFAVWSHSYASFSFGDMRPHPFTHMTLFNTADRFNEGKELYTLKLPDGVVPADLEKAIDIFASYPTALKKLLETYNHMPQNSPKEKALHPNSTAPTKNEKFINNLEETVNLLEQVLTPPTSSEKILSLESDRSDDQEVNNLLLDITSILATYGGFDNQKSLESLETLKKNGASSVFQKDFQLLNRGYALPPHQYLKYYSEEHLLALARCFALTKVLETLQVNFYATSESFSSMLTRTLDCITEKSETLATLFRSLEKTFKSIDNRP